MSEPTDNTIPADPAAPLAESITNASHQDSDDYIEPHLRTPQDWVNYYLQIESDVLEGKEVTFDSGRRVLMEDLAEIRRGRHEWERRLLASKRRRGNSFGGFRVKTADMSR